MRRALLVALALMLFVPVLAEGAMNPLRMVRGGDRSPSAQMWAKGGGVMTVFGRLTVYGRIVDPGTVTVLDGDGDAEVYLAGVAQELTDGRIRVRNAQGILFVKNADSVQITGPGLNFSVAGSGRARLQGSGTYRLNSDREKRWSGAWISVSRPSAEQRRVRACAECSSPVASRR